MFVPIAALNGRTADMACSLRVLPGTASHNSRSSGSRATACHCPVQILHLCGPNVGECPWPSVLLSLLFASMCSATGADINLDMEVKNGEPGAQPYQQSSSNAYLGSISSRPGTERQKWALTLGSKGWLSVGRKTGSSQKRTFEAKDSFDHRLN